MSCTATSSGLKSASTAVAARPAKLMSVQVIADSADATVVVYDNASAASGTELVKVVVPTATKYNWFVLDEGIEAKNGLYLSISGTGAQAIVTYGLL